HSSSVSEFMRSLRFEAYVVPHGPRHPRGLPVSHFSTGISPAASVYPAVWQSLHPAILTMYSPLAYLSCSVLSVLTGTFSCVQETKKAAPEMAAAAISKLEKIDLTFMHPPYLLLALTPPCSGPDRRPEPARRQGRPHLTCGKHNIVKIR